MIPALLETAPTFAAVVTHKLHMLHCLEETVSQSQVFVNGNICRTRELGAAEIGFNHGP